MLMCISLMLFQTMNPVIASALMPGLGQQIQGEQSKARIFYTVEGAIWLSYFGFNYMGNKIEVSARAYAIKHAEGNPARTKTITLKRWKTICHQNTTISTSRERRAGSTQMTWKPNRSTLTSMVTLAGTNGNGIV